MASVKNYTTTTTTPPPPPHVNRLGRKLGKEDWKMKHAAFTMTGASGNLAQE